MTPFETDRLLSRLAAVVRGLDAPPRDPPWNSAELADLLPPDQRRMPAAVLVAVVPRSDGPHVVLTQRTAHLKRHAGQVSFPGGRADADDGGPLQTALREAEEEVGIPPTLLRPIGYLDRYDTITGFRVTPVLAELSPRYVARPDPGEVASVFEVPMAFILDPANRALRSVEYAGRRRDYFEFSYGAHTIWGVTAAILVHLGQQLTETA